MTSENDKRKKELEERIDLLWGEINDNDEENRMLEDEITKLEAEKRDL